jgi:hypothetical protein
MYKRISLYVIILLSFYSCNKIEVDSASISSNHLKEWSAFVVKNYGIYEKKFTDSISNIADVENTTKLSLSKNRSLLLIKLKTIDVSFLAIIINGTKYETYGILRTSLKTTDSEFINQVKNSITNSKISNNFLFERFDIHNQWVSRYQGISGDKIKETSLEKGYRYSNNSNNIKSNSCDNYYLIVKVDGVIVFYEFAYSVCNNATLDMPDLIYAGDGSVYLEDKIITDTSIINNANIKCVYEKLAGSVLKDILAGFSNSDVYNLRITLNPNLPSDIEGHTDRIGNNDFRISINPNLIDNDFSKIWTASIFIHEAFHAELFLKIQQSFGGQDFSKWPKPIADMDLQELMNYFEQESKDKNIWNSVQHDWMVNHLDLMAGYLRNYVSAYYPSIYNNINSLNLGLEPYQSLMYRGLEKSTLFKEKQGNNYNYPNIAYLVTNSCGN